MNTATTLVSHPVLPRSAAGPYNPWFVAAVLSIAPFMEVLDTTIANVSLTHIAGSIGASQDESTWIITSYLVANTMILPITGWLTEVVGRKRLYVTCLALFTVSSVMCAFSTSLQMIVIARVLQGLGGAALNPVAQMMQADSFVPEKRGQVFSLLAITVIVAPATAPVFGGWITDNLSWHWVFLINLPIGLIALTLTGIFVTEPPVLVKERIERLKDGLKLDYIGLFFIFIGFGLLQILLDKFQEDDGFSSPFIITAFAIVIFSLSFLVVWEWNTPHPIMNFRLFRIRNFMVGLIGYFIMGFIIISSTQLLPQMTQTLMGYNAETSGMVLAGSSIVSLILTPIAGIITGRYIQPKWLLLAAFIQLGLGMIWLSTISPAVSFDTLSFYRIITTISSPFIFVPITMACYVGVPAKNISEATALINRIRNLGGGIGVSFISTNLVWRTQFHHARLVESITPYSNLHGLTIAQIAPLIQSQAAFMSYLDMFRVSGLIALLSCPIVLFLASPSKATARDVVIVH